MTFHSQVTSLLFQRGILLFQSQTFHSKSKSMSESPGVSNCKGCFGSPNWLFYASLLKGILESGDSIGKSWPFTLKWQACSFNGGSCSYKAKPFTLNRFLWAKAQEFPTEKAALQPQLAFLRFASEGFSVKWRFRCILMTFHAQVTNLLF